MLELQLPVHEVLVHLGPVFVGGSVVYLHGYAAHILLVTGIDSLGDDILLVDVLLQRQQYLVGVDRLDEVVGNLGADGLVHDVLLLALGHHHHRHGGLHLLDERQRLESREARHILIEQDKVIVAFAATIQRITSVGRRVHLVVLSLEKKDMGTQEFYLVVNPKQRSVLGHRILHI